MHTKMCVTDLYLILESHTTSAIFMGGDLVRVL